MTLRVRPGLLLALGAALAAGACVAQERANFFNDPFEQATSGIPACPVPQGPLITRQEMLAQTHGRAERGTTCYQTGRCRLPNAYLYDPDIVARSKKAILADGRFGGTSVWLLGQRRWVWLQGCVRTRAEAETLERIIRSLDDVENVMNELKVVPAP